MKKISMLLCITLGLIWTLPFASGKTTFKAGKDYEVIGLSATASTPANQKIKVVEFFNYGCPACFRFEPYLEKWLKKNKKRHIIFSRSPVVFESGWDLYAKAYFVAKLLGKSDVITPALFNRIHQERKPPRTQAALKRFFEQYTVPGKTFDAAMENSILLDIEMKKAAERMQLYKVYSIPTIVVNHRYKVDMAHGGANKFDPKRMLAVVDSLIKKSMKERTSH